VRGGARRGELAAFKAGRARGPLLLREWGGPELKGGGELWPHGAGGERGSGHGGAGSHAGEAGEEREGENGGH
jgi:hypothetical protein